MIPSAAQFRDVGFTADAANFPLSRAAQEVVAEHNGVTVERMPEAFKYAPNAYMRDWLEALGSAATRRHASGRWLLPRELA
jgi:hypothetical protein